MDDFGGLLVLRRLIGLPRLCVRLCLGARQRTDPADRERLAAWDARLTRWAEAAGRTWPPGHRPWAHKGECEATQTEQTEDMEP